MKWVLKFRWPLLVIWLVLLFGLIFTAPSMSDLVREKGEIKLPDGYPSQLATELQKKHNPDSDGETYLAVYTSKEKLTKTDKKKIENSLDAIKKDQEELHVTDVLDSFDQKELADKFVSKDGKTIVASLTVDAKETPVKTIREKLDQKMEIRGLDTYLTGNAVIQEDVVQGSQDGLHKTEGITVVFILVVLLLVFRSAVAPFIPLITVGISYLTAQSVVSFLVKYLDFPVSTYTQIFMVCIMFGIGTDYCILLLSRFKEELGEGLASWDAAIQTYKTAGKTVLYSAIAVLVAFISLYFVQFDLYRSAVAIGVGIVILMLGIYTLVPFFMGTLGRVLFWPLNKNISHKESRFWGAAGNLAFMRPFIALLIVAIIVIPPIVMHKGTESFDSLDEISSSYPSKKGFEIVSDSFGAGQVSPTQIYLENDDNMRTGEYIALLEKVSTDLADLKDVDMVMSASRPAGTRLDAIYVKNQAGQLENGLGDAKDGIREVKKGLNDAGNELNASAPSMNQAISGIDSLQSGTAATKAGITQLEAALVQIRDGIKSGQSGAGELKRGVQTARSELKKLSDGESKLLQGYTEVQANLQKLADSLASLSNSSRSKQTIDTSALTKQMQQVGASLKAFAAAHPEATQNAEFQKLMNDVAGLETAGEAFKTQLQSELGKQTAALETKIKQLNDGLNQLSSAMKTLNSQSNQVSSGLTAFDSGLGQLEKGLSELETGLGQAASGQDQVISQLPQIKSALTQLESGQGELKTGFSSMSGQIGDLSNGLLSGASGLSKIESGLGEASGMLEGLSETSYANSGVYVPDELLANKDFKQALDQYISKAGKLATINVVLKKNPYSNEAMDAIDAINDQLDSSLKGTKLENAKIGIGGMTSMNYDTRDMSLADYHLVIILVLVSVFVTLVILLRSMVMPLYLVGSIVLTYYAALGFTEIIFTRIMDYGGLTWATPFFSFVVLVALGIDYSIFLMSRFNEYTGLDVRERMLLTMKNMGGVIFSAVIILGGTFAAMMPAGVLSLLEIATVVLIGLILYAVIVLPLFIPVMVKLFGRGNWWPFVSNKEEQNDKK